MRYVVFAMGIAAAFSASADIYMLKDGMTDWKSAGSYTNNAIPTLSTDVIVTEANATNRILTASARYADAFEMINLVSKVELGRKAVLEIEVAQNDTKTLTGQIVPGSSNLSLANSGTLIKTGPGLLLQESTDRPSTVYYAKWDVRSGTLGGPWSQNDDGKGKNVYNFGLTIAAGARFLNSYSSFLQIQGPLTGAGSIETLHKARQASVLYLLGGPGEYSGFIGTNMTIRVRSGRVDFTGTTSKFDGNLIVSGFLDDGKDAGVAGFMKFGSDQADDSSFGNRSSLDLGTFYNTKPYAGAIRYLGTVPETIGSKAINIDATVDAPATIDAGAFGGLTFGPSVYWKMKNDFSGTVPANQRLCLTGSNVTACVFSGVLNTGDHPECNFYLTKKGMGVWRLNDNVYSCFAGPIRIEDGVLRHDTLAHGGTRCALGTATRLFDDASVPPADETKVDYAILFGGVGRGLLEYCGTYDAFCTNRPVAVRTSGGFSTTEAATRICGIGAYDKTDGAAELVLMATNDATSVYADITDGTHGGKLGVTKRGTGTAELDRTLSFSGPLKVEAGTLVVRNSSGPYTWFRLIVKQNIARLKGDFNPSSDDPNLVIVNRFALYDVNGVRQNVGFSRYDGNLDPTPSNGYNVKSPADCIRPGQIAYDRADAVACWKNASTGARDIQNMCRIDANYYDTDALVYTRYGDTPALSPTEPSTWVKFVMRLTNGTPEIASWDIATRFGYKKGDTSSNRFRAPTMLEIQGSVDGISWDSLTNYSHAVVTDEDAVINAGKWYSDGVTDSSNTVDGRRWQDGKSFPLRGRPATPAAFNVLGNCTSVSVAPGASLVKAGSESVTLKGLTVSTNGFGRIEGFVLSGDSSSTLTVLGDVPTGELTIPGVFANTDVSGLSNWKVKYGNREKPRHSVVATENGIKVIPSGMLLIVR